MDSLSGSNLKLELEIRSIKVESVDRFFASAVTLGNIGLMELSPRQFILIDGVSSSAASFNIFDAVSQVINCCLKGIAFLSA